MEQELNFRRATEAEDMIISSSSIPTTRNDQSQRGRRCDDDDQQQITYHCRKQLTNRANLSRPLSVFQLCINRSFIPHLLLLLLFLAYFGKCNFFLFLSLVSLLRHFLLCSETQSKVTLVASLVLGVYKYHTVLLLVLFYYCFVLSYGRLADSELFCRFLTDLCWASVSSLRVVLLPYSLPNLVVCLLLIRWHFSCSLVIMTIWWWRFDGLLFSFSFRCVTTTTKIALMVDSEEEQC